MRKFISSAAFACSGIRFAFRTQGHMKFHAAAALLVCLFAYVLSLKPLEWAIILLTIALVMGAELLNTAIEQVVDLASPAIHPIAKAAKDVAAGAVLITAMFAAVIGLLIFGPHLWQLLL